MSEEYETERKLSRAEIADIFESFADGLRGGGEITLAIGGEQVRIDPADMCEFEAEVEEESSRIGSAERSVEFEVEWDRGSSERDLVE
jgi:amphi-Trp domain-containing protein